MHHLSLHTSTHMHSWSRSHGPSAFVDPWVFLGETLTPLFSTVALSLSHLTKWRIISPVAVWGQINSGFEFLISSFFITKNKWQESSRRILRWGFKVCREWVDGALITCYRASSHRVVWLWALKRYLKSMMRRKKAELRLLKQQYFTSSYPMMHLFPYCSLLPTSTSVYV